MNRLTFALAPLMLAVTQVACTTVPPLAPIERKPVPEAKYRDPVVKLTLGQMLAKYAPPSFAYDPQAPDVDFSRPVHFDSSLPWPVAFEKALSDAGIDRLTLNQPATATAEIGVVATGSVDVPSVTMSDAKAPTVLAAQQSTTTPTHVASPQMQHHAAVQPAMEPSVPQCVPDAGPNSEPLLTWDAVSNASLKQTLESWSRTAGWEVSWGYIDEQTNTGTDLTLGGGKKCVGSYKDAVRTLIDSFPEGDHVHADLWSGNSPPLLRVFNKGKENK